MMIGVAITREGLDSTLGDIALRTNETFRRVRQMQEWLAAQTDAALITYGYTAGEVAVIKSAFADLDQLRTIYEGGAALASAKDFRAFAKQVWGLGF